MDVIEFESGYPDRGHPHKSYLTRGESGSWYAQTESRVPTCLSTYARNGALLGILMARAETPEAALAVFKENAYKRFAENARII